MREFIAETQDGTALRAWLNPEDSNDVIADPKVPRSGGWRIVIERIGVEGEDALIRSTWEQTIEEALRHMDLVWPEKAVWRDYKTGEVVVLD